MTVTIHHGDCRDVLAEMAAESVHAVVTDPPYHLSDIGRSFQGQGGSTDPRTGRERSNSRSTGFMGQKWDGGDVAFDPATWREVLRVMKPGAYLLAFGGTRTYHRLACAIEDAGFEIRDQVGWLYGSGFPKGTDKAKIPAEWKGFNTALKPAWEPIVLARKPMIGSLAQNLQAHGCGALNVDGCRIEAQGRPLRDAACVKGDAKNVFGDGLNGSRAIGDTDLGRWPANVIHDGSEEVLACFPDVHGAVVERPQGDRSAFPPIGMFGGSGGAVGHRFGDDGNAARFFYCAKADREDRNDGLQGLPAKALNWSSGEQNPGAFQSPNTNRSAQNHHPTVKPTDLMTWLCKLITPPGGLILDPFMGSGSTGRGAVLGDFQFIGIEREAEYIEIADRRIRAIAPLLLNIKSVHWEQIFRLRKRAVPAQGDRCGS